MNEELITAQNRRVTELLSQTGFEPTIPVFGRSKAVWDIFYFCLHTMETLPQLTANHGCGISSETLNSGFLNGDLQVTCILKNTQQEV
jgi:hypothetical protein